ncbi:photosynthetic protein synthase I [bacterium]|nr:photosynthetic protein synthase I [bacterium]
MKTFHLLLLSVVAPFLFAPPKLVADQPVLSPLPPPLDLDADRVALGEKLFFDTRLSGDTTLSCASCHIPSKGWADGLPLSDGYPGSLYFRNTPTLVNSSYQQFAYWDGRLNFNDLQTVVRDHIAEAHFFQADGRLVSERLRQVPEYEATFQEVFHSEPQYGGILKAVAAFVQSLRAESALDRYLLGDSSALTPQEVAGLSLFSGKARCVSCHNGDLLSDESFHLSGVSSNEDIWRVPERHITWRRFMRTLGVPDFVSLRTDEGLYFVTKEDSDRGLFRTPSLRGIPSTAPYFHNGTVSTLEDVISFYNEGGHDGVPLGLSSTEVGELLAFLESLAFENPPKAPPKMTSPTYEIRILGEF